MDKPEFITQAEVDALIRENDGSQHKPYIDPLNHYSGEVSVMALLENWTNGHRTFPHNMGETKRPS